MSTVPESTTPVRRLLDRWTLGEIGTALGWGGSTGSIPTGVICMWGGLLANIPTGWVLCDGTNGTPDLRSQFIKGSAAGVNPGVTGGAATHTHTNGTLATDNANTTVSVNDHASHTHTYTQVPNHVHVEQAQGGTTASTSGTHLMTSTSTGGSLRSSGQSTANPTGGVATGTTNGPSATLAHTVNVSAHNHTLSGAIASGSSEPAYYSLAFIQKT